MVLWILSWGKVAQRKDLLSTGTQLKACLNWRSAFKSTGLPPMETESAGLGGDSRGEVRKPLSAEPLLCASGYTHYHMTLWYIHEDDYYIHFPSNLWNFPVRTVYIIPILSQREENWEAPRDYVQSKDAQLQAAMWGSDFLPDWPQSAWWRKIQGPRMQSSQIWCLKTTAASISQFCQRLTMWSRSLEWQGLH